MTTYHTLSVDGLNIFYREAGDPQSPSLVLLHGFPSSSHMFRDLIPALADRFHLIAPDYPGFGYSAMPAAESFDYTFDHFADVMDRFLEGLDVSRYSVYMQDYGGPIGLRLASRHPERVEALILQNANACEEGIGGAFEPMKPFWAERTPETEVPARSLLTRDTTIFQYTHGVRDTKKINPDAWETDQRLLDRPGSDAVQLAMLHDYPSNIALYPKWHEYFRQHKPPALIVWGKNDPFFTEEGAWAFQRDLPDAEVHLLDTGHFALEEDTAVIASHIRRFLTEKSTTLAPVLVPDN